MLGGNSGYTVDNKIMGVIRFAETPDGCLIDGTVDGLAPGKHGMHIHECGDISQGCDRWAFRVFIFCFPSFLFLFEIFYDTFLVLENISTQIIHYMVHLKMMHLDG